MKQCLGDIKQICARYGVQLLPQNDVLFPNKWCFNRSCVEAMPLVQSFVPEVFYCLKTLSKYKVVDNKGPGKSWLWKYGAVSKLCGEKRCCVEAALCNDTFLYRSIGVFSERCLNTSDSNKYPCPYHISLLRARQSDPITINQRT